MPSSLGIVASGEHLLNDAVLWLDASQSSVSGGKLTNLGKGGSALDAQFGSTTSTDTNDPLLLTHTGTNYLYLPGTAGNYVSVPDSAPLSITGDIEIVMRVALVDWTPASAQVLVGKFGGPGNTSYNVNVNATGNIVMSTSTNGTATTSAPSSVVAPFTDNTPYWLKITRASATGNINYYQAADQATEPTVFTQIGTQVSNTAGAIFDSTAVQEIGSINAGTAAPAAGKFYRVIIRNGIGGTTVFDANFTTGITSGSQATFTESSVNAATVTINRTTSGRKSAAVTRPALLFGTDDYLEVADNALLNFAASDSFTVLAVFREHATPASFASFVSKRDSGAGWILLRNASLAGRGYMFINDGTLTTDTAGLTGTYTQGNLSVLTGVRDVTLDKLRHYVNATVAGADITDSTTASLSNALAMRIGRNAGAGAGYADMEFFAAAVWRRALTASEIATIVARYGAA